jgi:hypothetical protein
MQIHYFPRYSQKENFVTNNTLLLLREFYNYNRFRFQSFLIELFRMANADFGQAIELGLQLRQQIGTKESVLDGFLYQDSFRIAIETKRSAHGFGADQLRRHLSGFTSDQEGILILLSPEMVKLSQPNLSLLLKSAKSKNVNIVSISFQTIIDAARNSLSDHDEEMHALVSDYETFCSDEELLPSDKWTLFVPPCGRSHNINVSHRIYFCPASWSRRSAKYLGIYFEKAVRYIGEIEKVVECEVIDKKVTSKTTTLTKDEECRIIMTVTEARQQRGLDLESGYQFFICSNLVATMFKKTSPGGIMGHRYFDLRQYVGSVAFKNVADIAQGLNGAEWKEPAP